MTARKPKTQTEPKYVSGDVHPDDAHGSGQTIQPSHEAEHEQDVVSEAKPAERLEAITVAKIIAEQVYEANRADGNRLTFVFEGPNGLVQTFHATVEEGIREF